MIEYIQGRIPYIEGDVVVNAANAVGWMGGLYGRFKKMEGVAESIHYADPSIERISKRLFKKEGAKAGQVIHTSAGSLNYPGGILHAITMNKPGMESNLSIVKECIDNIVIYCESKHVNTVVLPLLGTGTGRLDRKAVLDLYEKKLKNSITIFKVVI